MASTQSVATTECTIALLLCALYFDYYLTMIASAKKRVRFGEVRVREFDRATMESAKKRVRFVELPVREFDGATMESAKKRVRFGEVRVRQFDRATMGEHPLTRGGFALQLGQRYQDLPPVAIPNKERMQRGGKKRRPRHVHEPQRKEIWKEQLRFEQELLNRGLCGRILRVGRKGSTDEQRFFERQGQTKKPLLEQTMDEQRLFEYQTPLERRLEQQPPRKFASERKWIRRRRRWIRQWRADQAIIDHQFKRWRREMREKMERRRVRREIREKMERRRLRREMREKMERQEMPKNERRRMLQEQPSEETKLKRQEPHDNGRVEVEPSMHKSSSSKATAGVEVFLFVALGLAFVSALMIILLIVPFLLDTLFGLSICKFCFAMLSANGFTQEYRQSLSFCTQYCSVRDCCLFVLACLCFLALFL
jgi:hypothetical protein